MSTLKLSVAASTYRKSPYELQKWVRNIAPSAVDALPTTTVATASFSSSSSSFKTAAINSSTNNRMGERISVVLGWTMMQPYPPPLRPTHHHHHKPSAQNLGFHLHYHHKPNAPSFASSSCCSFPYSSSSEEKGSIPSSSAGPPLPHEMGFENDRPPPSPPPQHCQPSKFLTLPTILTLGRVAAVPLLVSSTFVFVFVFDCIIYS